MKNSQHNPAVGLIVKTEPEMTGIYRWAFELQQAINQNNLLQPFEVSSPDNFFYKKIVYPLSQVLGKDLKTAFKNYPNNFSNPDNASPQLWHLASQTFAGILPKLKKPGVITVFDLYPYIFDVYGSRKDKAAFLRAFKEISKANHILTISRAVKNEVCTILNKDLGNVSVVYPGIKNEFVENKLLKRDPYSIVYVGSELPRKNLNKLFQALAIVFKRIPEAHFIKIGRSQWPGSRSELILLSQKLKIENRIKFLDYVDDLPSVYSKAGVSVLVSTYEGFGYPVLEAMACGALTVISDIPTLKETSGENSILVDPMDPNSIADGICSGILNENKRNQLTSDGLKWAKKFNFNQWKNQMIEFYKGQGVIF